ncbi:hypothetical protein Pmani_017845 [Petrolisthes manimaculis]|uniref:Uncharacterized protein n=1 Tax=Petrolisthes manimaculis TaxID=1843537 RepID=A0AAE1PNL1_9EUCA|nr:hypothetical protein Pmani_017845 [Petrolisthes manimaculis]
MQDALSNGASNSVLFPIVAEFRNYPYAEHVVNKAIMGFEFTKYRGPILLGSVIATLSLAYNFRMELIGDLSQEKAVLHQQTDENDAKRIRAHIRDYHMNLMKSSNPDK